MEKRILISDTDLAVYPIGLGTADIRCAIHGGRL